MTNDSTHFISSSDIPHQGHKCRSPEPAVISINSRFTAPRVPWPPRNTRRSSCHRQITYCSTLTTKRLWLKGGGSVHPNSRGLAAGGFFTFPEKRSRVRSSPSLRESG